MRACEFAGRFNSCASSWSVAIREPTIHPTGRNRPHFLPTEAFFADRAALSQKLALLPAVLFEHRAGPYYYRTCTVLENYLRSAGLGMSTSRMGLVPLQRDDRGFVAEDVTHLFHSMDKHPGSTALTGRRGGGRPEANTYRQPLDESQ